MILKRMAAPAKLERAWLHVQESALARLSRFAARGTPANLRTGLEGEQAALFDLRRRGVTIVARRWTSARLRGDVDLIGWDGATLCFFEVKTRTARDMTPAESQVDDDKRRTLRSLARAYLRSFPASQRGSVPVRFDVVSVYLLGAAPEIEHFPGAFGWS
ncbi:MAG TPA: YraN family protein [Acidobacteriaceae bacterium]|nr:YraN family protein [Acidobacteriaceae bacterium]